MLVPFAGSDDVGFRDGTSSTSQFNQPYGICIEERSLFESDTSCGRIAVISDLCGRKLLLTSLESLYRAFGIHEKR